MSSHHFPIPAPLSPHKLFQILWQAVEEDNDEEVKQLVDALEHGLHGNQTIATSSVMELMGAALRRRRSLEVKKALTHLPGFDANASIEWGGPALIDAVTHEGDAEFAAYLARKRSH